MSAIKKPVTALIGVLAMLFAGLFFAATSASAYPTGTAATIGVSNSTPPVGGTDTVFGAHYQPGETVSLSLHSAVYSLGSATADGSGAFSTTVTLPAGVSGSHTIVGTGLTSGETASVQINIGGTSSSGSGSGSGLSSTGVAVIGIGAVGLALLVGGGLLLMAGKRRKVSA